MCMPSQQKGDWPVVVFLHGGSLRQGLNQGGQSCNRRARRRGIRPYLAFKREQHSRRAKANRWVLTTLPVRCVLPGRSVAEYGGDNSLELYSSGIPLAGASGKSTPLGEGDDFHGDCVVEVCSALPDAFVGLDGSDRSCRKSGMKSTYEKNPAAWCSSEPLCLHRIDWSARQEVEFYINTGLEQELVADGTRLAEGACCSRLHGKVIRTSLARTI